MRNRAFTMVEIVFVIVIIGILVSIAIPKLSVTKDDALIATEKVNYEHCVKDLIKEYSTLGHLNVKAKGNGVMTEGPQSCMAMKCLIIDIYNGGTSGDFMVKPSAESINIPYCHKFIPMEFPEYNGSVVYRYVFQEKYKFFN